MVNKTIILKYFLDFSHFFYFWSFWDSCPCSLSDPDSDSESLPESEPDYSLSDPDSLSDSLSSLDFVWARDFLSFFSPDLTASGFFSSAFFSYLISTLAFSTYFSVFFSSTLTSTFVTTGTASGFLISTLASVFLPLVSDFFSATG